MKRLNRIFLSLLTLSVLASCEDDMFLANGGQDSPVTIAVSLDKGSLSRASVGKEDQDDEDFIINGDFGIFLGLRSGGLGVPEVHCCSFTGTRKGLIYPVVSENGRRTPSDSPLTWSDKRLTDIIAFNFLLDNMGYDHECELDEEKGFLGWAWSDEEKNKTYAAQKESYDAEGNPLHTNDIIWGRGRAEYGKDGTKASIVELNHRMTRINVACVNTEGILDENQRRDMTISITNLVFSTEGFNRYDGTVSIADEPVRATLDLKKAGEDLTYVDDGTGYKEYHTSNFILPPQPLDVKSWPKVEVTYTDKEGNFRKVSGLVPHDILNESNSWVALDELRAGNHLTVVVEIKEDIPEIIFTAKVKKWVELGPMTVTATQRKAGINNMDELNEFIRMYNSLPVFTNTTDFSVPTIKEKTDAVDDLMLLYGKPETLKVDAGGYDVNVIQWTVPINFDLEGKVPSPGFRNIMWETAKSPGTIAFSYPLVLTSDPALNTDAELEALKGKKGIYNIEDLNAMVSTVIVDVAGSAGLYGDYDSKMLTYAFDLRDNISGEVLRKLPEVVGNVTFKYVMNDNGYSINGSKDVYDIVQRKGIYTLDDLNAMISAVNADIMSADAAKYGDLDAEKLTYTFDLRANITGTVVGKLPKTVYGSFDITYIMKANGFTVNGSSDVNDLIE